MPTLRIALAQDNPIVGDLDHNADLIRRAASAATAAGAHLLATGEQSLTGYPVEDLALRHSFVEASRDRLVRLAEEIAADGNGSLPVAVGYLDADGPIGSTTGHGIRNALALLQDGKVLFRYYKHHLPNYGVFDEDRWFVAGHELHLARIGGVDVAFTVCEDVWGGVPFTVAEEAGAGLVVNINASPYEQGKHERRLAVVKERAAGLGAPVAYLNTVGGQDDLVFDGGSIIVAADGSVLSSARRFASELLVTDVECPASGGRDIANHSSELMSTALHVLSAEPKVLETRVEPSFAPELGHHEEVWEALRLGLADYVNKNGFPSVLIGLSGGIDSAVTTVLARDAIGADRVFTVANPSQFSSQHSLDDAADLAERCGITHVVEPIQPIVDAYLSEIAVSGLALENLQARVRGVIWMSLSNQHGHLVLAAGNKSEYAVGYSTLYGDSCGGFAPIKDVLKTLVYELANWRNEKARSLGETEPIPENIIMKPPSAELRPDQLDSDSLPDYAVLDGILVGYVDGDAGREDLVEQGYPAEVVERIAGLVDRAEYKRRQSAPGTKITVKSFGRDRRLPITNHFRGKPGRGK
ncbi:NAD+ synthase [Glycomyces luteolus]|uniref:Glutamine-dependent NAD(+) synthetase n=1 Tax=Glycomyces luteolus TaxID=2670330 RepID=A0A9X3P8K8_9ACTN|nr:NAD+ synthase [Glycomyces luteolus]MDA1360738.1 NAD+ synthase [Glycomyces luteolus]